MIYVFDFDKTITKIHTGHMTPQQVQALPISALIKDPAGFSKYVNMLLGAGHKVAIASFGNKDTITATMRRLSLSNILITTPRDFGYSDNSEALVNKCLQLDAICGHYRVAKDSVRFYDDSKNNIIAAKQHGYGHSYWCPDGLSFVQGVS